MAEEHADTDPACIELAAVSLLLPAEPSYDPWAWLVWAREIGQLEQAVYVAFAGI
ncbi:MAG TPA: hypothetical protein VG126_04685 [Thermoleophilaceae bacterium]|nr:hypothetical protein [Thermoleophilaceae bacterium]